jgi:L-lysine 2,3-aminomutase
MSKEDWSELVEALEKAGVKPGYFYAAGKKVAGLKFNRTETQKLVELLSPSNVKQEPNN